MDATVYARLFEVDGVMTSTFMRVNVMCAHHLRPPRDWVEFLASTEHASRRNHAGESAAQR
jgi:hypothetical protein